MIPFFLIVFLILAIGHLVAYFAFTSIFPRFFARHIISVRIVFALLMISFSVASMLARQYDSIFTNIFYTLSAVWMGFLLYIFLAGILYGIVRLILHFVRPDMNILWLGKALMSLAILTGIYGLFNANDLVVTRYTISVPDLPEAWQGREAVFLADAHLGQVRGSGFIEKVVKKIEELDPDIVFDAGDLYDGGAVDANELIAPIKNLNLPLGYYFVTGNHESYGDINIFLKAIKNAGIKDLNNEAVEVEGVKIVGADYESTRTPENLRRILQAEMVDKEEKNEREGNVATEEESKMPAILLKHVPFDLDVAEEENIFLQLSGHTHRAQVWPLMYITHAVYDGYDYGLQNFGSMKVLVTDGVGTWGPPLRVGTNSEIVLITFEKE